MAFLAFGKRNLRMIAICQQAVNLVVNVLTGVGRVSMLGCIHQPVPNPFQATLAQMAQVNIVL